MVISRCGIITYFICDVVIICILPMNVFHFHKKKKDIIAQL